MTLGNDNGTDGQTDRQTEGQTDRQTDRVRRNMRPPPREEGRIIKDLFLNMLYIQNKRSYTSKSNIPVVLAPPP